MLSLTAADLTLKGAFYVVFEEGGDPVEQTVALLKKLKKESKTGIYISFMRSASVLDQQLRKSYALDNVRWYISPFIDPKADTYRAIRIEGTQSLSEVLFGITEITKADPGEDFIILDSFDALLEDNSEEILGSFLSRMAKVAKELDYVSFVLIINKSPPAGIQERLRLITDGEISLGGV